MLLVKLSHRQKSNHSLVLIYIRNNQVQFSTIASHYLLKSEPWEWFLVCVYLLQTANGTKMLDAGIASNFHTNHECVCSVSVFTLFIN